jgi:hypothetical protein
VKTDNSIIRREEMKIDAEVCLTHPIDGIDEYFIANGVCIPIDCNYVSADEDEVLMYVQNELGMMFPDHCDLCAHEDFEVKNMKDVLADLEFNDVCNKTYV